MNTKKNRPCQLNKKTKPTKLIKHFILLLKIKAAITSPATNFTLKIGY